MRMSPTSSFALAASVLLLLVSASRANAGCCGEDAPDPEMAPTTRVVSLSTSGNATPGKSAPAADRAMDAGAAAFESGEMPQACDDWNEAAREYAAARRLEGQCDALLNLAEAQQSIAKYRDAGQSLTDAAAVADRLNDRSRVLLVLDHRGALFTLTRQFDSADSFLTRAVSIARDAKDSDAMATSLNDLGNLRWAQGNDDAARDAYQQSADAALKAGNSLAAVRATANAASVEARAGTDPAKAADLARTALDQAGALPDGHEKATILLSIGRAFEEIGKPKTAGASPDAQSFASAQDAYQKALIAGAGDDLSTSYALGYTGHLYELEGQTGPALQYTRHAEFLAQRVRSPFAEYRWQWQIGRLLAAQGQTDAAIAEYNLAAATLQSVQADIAFGYGNQSQPGSFRESVGPLYYQLADLLLRRSDGISNEDDLQHTLHEARATVELLKQAELEDYFQDPCANRLKALAKPVEDIASHTAVIYLISLPDRTEMLIGIGSKLNRVKVPIGADELDTEVRDLREKLEDRTTNRYLKPSRKLYDWLIRPIEPLLDATAVDTLVFIPDGALRTIPMAALNDGKEFLIARYAIAVSPGLALMDPRPIRRVDVNVLEAGLSESIGGFPALDYVPEELTSVHQQFGGVELLNEGFTKARLKQELSGTSFSVVHIASHAQFTGDINHTFLLTYGNGADRAGHLTLDELSRYIQPSRFRDQPIELLTLSACQTAAGDDRAALGLAGVAIKAGARSAVATLWSVNDQAAEELISTFYADLRQDPTLSKAKILQKAQLRLLHDPRYRHPCYWSPFLVIGNWL
jgi:CHAT domain-containing protein